MNNSKFLIRYYIDFILTLSLVCVSTIGYAQNSDYEIWMSDQGNTQGITVTNPKGSYGGKVRIYSSKDLEKNPPINNPLV